MRMPDIAHHRIGIAPLLAVVVRAQIIARGSKPCIERFGFTCAEIEQIARAFKAGERFDIQIIALFKAVECVIRHLQVIIKLAHAGINLHKIHINFDRYINHTDVKIDHYTVLRVGFKQHAPVVYINPLHNFAV